MRGSKTNVFELIDEAVEKRVDAIVLHYAPGTIEINVIEELALLAKKRNIQLSFIMPVPVFDKNVPMSLLKSQNGMEKSTYQTISDYNNFNKDLINKISQIDYDKFRVYQVADVFCLPICKLISEDGRPLYFDNGHLTLTGSKKLHGVFERVITDLP
jgi:hypothetical protein